MPAERVRVAIDCFAIEQSFAGSRRRTDRAVSADACVGRVVDEVVVDAATCGDGSNLLGLADEENEVELRRVGRSDVLP